MTTNVYLFFNGQCEQALNEYAACFGGKVTGLMRYGDMGNCEQMGPDAKNLVMHAALRLQDTLIMASDSPQGQYQKPQGFAVAVDLPTPDEAERAFDRLAQGGAILMPLGETFWAQKFGALTDRFGTPWMIGCNKPMPQMQPEEVHAGA